MKSAPLSIAIVIILGIVVVVVVATPLTVYAGKQTCTQLWVYTEPVQKGPCVVFKHQSPQEIAAANNAAIKFNAGVVAGQKAIASAKCPSSDKDFCDGWNSVRMK